MKRLTRRELEGDKAEGELGSERNGDKYKVREGLRSKGLEELLGQELLGGGVKRKAN